MTTSSLSVLYPSINQSEKRIVNMILIRRRKFSIKGTVVAKTKCKSLSDLIDLEKQKRDGLTPSIVMCSIKLNKDTGKMQN